MMSFSDRGTGAGPDSGRVPPRPASTSRSTEPDISPSSANRDSPRPRFDFEAPASKGETVGVSGATWRKCVNGALGCTFSILMFQSGHPFLGLVAGGVAAVYGFFVGRDVLNEFGKK
jgi:hypothetical protein